MNGPAKPADVFTTSSRDTGLCFGFRFSDYQGKEIGLKETGLYVDEFEENDAWKTNNRELDADLESGHDKSF